MKASSDTEIIFANGHRHLRVPLLRPQPRLCLSLAVSVLKLEFLPLHKAVKLVQSPAKKGKLSDFGSRFLRVAVGFNHPSLKGQLLLHDSADEINPSPGFLHKVTNAVAEFRAASVSGHLRLLNILIKFKKILYHKKLPFSYLKRNRQITVFQRHSGYQCQAFVSSYGIGDYTVGPLLGKGPDQLKPANIRGIPQTLLLQPLLHQHHKGRQISTVLPPIVPAVIMLSAVRTLTLREENRISVENHMDGKIALPLGTSPHGFPHSFAFPAHVSAFHTAQSHLFLPVQRLSFSNNRLSQSHILPYGITVKILVLRKRHIIGQTALPFP